MINFAIILAASFAGFAFGFLLQKGRVAKFDTIVGQLLFKDFTMIKVMFTAIVVGSIGLHLLLDYGYITQLPIGPINLTRILVGGSLFGIGMSILGYCPGTAIAAWATGAKDAMFGILGMIISAFLFIKFSPQIQQCISFAPLKKIHTLPTLFNVSHWVIISVLSIILLVIIYADKKLKVLK